MGWWEECCEPTYKELKLVVGVEFCEEGGSCEPTYKELKQWSGSWDDGKM